MDDQDDLVHVYRRAVSAFGALVKGVGSDQWAAPTPCADWDVRQLVNHVVGENAWVVPLLDGRTIAEVGDALDGDLVGDDAGRTWDERAAPALAAASAAGAFDQVVHVSFGDIPGSVYISQITTDHVIHAWDLARGVGAPEDLDADLVAFAHQFLAPQADQWRAAGAFGPRVDVADDAPLQIRLLAIAGRTA